MSDDKLLEELAMAAQKARAKEPGAAWDALAAGELTDAERKALLASDDDGQLVELFTPLGDDFEAGVLADLLGGGAAAPPQESTLVPEQANDVVPPPVEATPAPANKPFWMLWAAPLLAVAAAALLLLALPMGGPDLPDYSWDVAGGDQIVRGSETVQEGVRKLTVGSALTVSARPDADVDGELAATAFVRQADGSLLRSPMAAEVAESGAVRWVGRAGRGALDVGATEVVVVVHPADATSAEVDAAAEGGEWPRVVVPVVVGAGQ